VAILRRARATGRRGVLIAISLVLTLTAGVGYFVNDALAATKPPAPTITSSPDDPTTTTATASATFAFTDTSGLTFKCSLDNAAYAACTSPKTYSGLAQGGHVFKVEAFSGTTASDPTEFDWFVTPPQPVITSYPTNPTASTTATFTYSDAQAGVTFQCAVVAPSGTPVYSSCPAGSNTYTNLAPGTYWFQVQARVGSLAPSPAARHLWTIDTAPPTITSTFPVAGQYYNNAGWTSGCSPVGICGSAADDTGVASVGVAIQQTSSGKFWNGSAFTSPTAVFNAASGTTTWNYAFARPIDATYTVSVRATDTLGNTTTDANLTKTVFYIDTAPPAAPVIGTKPTNPTTATAADFDFTDTTLTATFTCKLDSGVATGCTGDGTSGSGAVHYTGVGLGSHCFAVFATDKASNVSPTTTYCWTVNASNTPNAIAVSSGTPQFAKVGTNYAAPLVAKVTNVSNAPVSGASVTFTAPASGASGTFASPCSGRTCVVTTDAGGLATAPTFKANTTAGGYTVTASVTGVATPANFSLINSADFTMSGTVTAALFPGTSQRVNVVFTNPNPTPITIAANSITVTVSTSQAGCASSNFAVTHGPGVAVTIPGNTTISLSGLGVASSNWPVVTMIETHTNQNACRGASLTITFTGSATG
jgi:hypothetical protein